jgi:hypothetical protein
MERSALLVVAVLSCAAAATTYLLASTFSECSAALSPDSRWMAYASDESGGYEVYVQRFPTLGEKHRISTHGGIQPCWSRDGRELFYRGTGDRPKIMAVAVETRAAFASVRRGRFSMMSLMWGFPTIGPATTSQRTAASSSSRSRRRRQPHARSSLSPTSRAS